MSDETIMPFDFSNGGTPSIIKVIGVGGGGGNAVNHMYREGIHDVTFVVCNTDNQALNESPVPIKLQLGREGLGAGNRPERAKAAAEESMKDIESMLNDGCKMAFITAGMGGGTGTGAAPIIAKTAKDMGILTVGIVTIPFLFEGNKKIDQALDGVEEMSKHVDALLVINNERLRDVYSDLSVMNAFAKADDTLSVAAKSIAEIITIRGKINLDFNDVKTVLKDGGVALMSTGYGSGEGRVTQAINDALHSPLLNNNDIFNSKKVLFNISYSTNSDLMMEEMNEVHEFMSRFGDDVETKWGLYIDDSLESKVKFTILATGFGIKDIPGMDDALNKKRTAEEQKRHEEEERIRQIKEKRRDDYYTNERRNDRKKGNYKYYIFTQDDLDNDDVISIVDTTPTYKRSKTVLDNIRQRATDSESLVQKPQLNENGSTMITFS
ncbi:cell division protein FtsZ [Bacteroides gallinaceum]|jgi:cell division protein FtsZ|uniref:Cell division protein FtsZ n=2 Tax=Bacteroidaceae TaxID=815 RepID=A0ABT7X9K5_9BACE|nr:MULTISPECIES: cell division protein FtsZ [Bacteroidaceae]CCZ70897.1 cell division protein FtsZ [Bacteroides sp. CAG:702]HJD10846.1 cell division protein FtsZ [Candidatus Phocaeicola caecigallinarum]MBD8041525.1 cell division protein FtsZ [Phocaeicola intestinalis]MBM6659826.1 cell division protein FtsZ [Bacteroides gallinaceum]MBM6720552.1 cell division protein FtsZ [Bacteroides gallinaceum]